MNYATLMGAVNNMYDVNDRLGVELMGRGKWNGLKKIVTRMSADAINKAAKNNGFRCRAVPAVTVADPLCSELFGCNKDYCVSLLGSYGFSDLWSDVKETTHNILNAGSKIPVADAAVQRFRDIENVFKTGSDAADAAVVVYDNRGKIILGGALLAFLIYLLMRNKKKR